MPTKTPPISTEITRTTSPKLHFDWQDWLPLLADDSIPEAQARELIETVWSIVSAFMQLGCDVSSTTETCGKDIDLTALLNAAVLDSQDAQAIKPVT
ncbi:hypothetical protein EBB79_15075 [Parasedimentitalea marina]|uniref:Uncharacterized protein n=2 Tax=Parasedimentitalea marina TaxID=2483033 RepID=A0A3T0N4U9_9RHOB|nr:hypothetical protein EBB79_15075 [Parasedimentitalea marina]